MGVTSFEELRSHIGHDVTVVYYGREGNPVNVSIECNDCNEVLFDIDVDAPTYKYKITNISDPNQEHLLNSKTYDDALSEALTVLDWNLVEEEDE